MFANMVAPAVGRPSGQPYLMVHRVPINKNSCEFLAELRDGTDGNLIRWCSLTETCLEHAEAQAVFLYKEAGPTHVNGMPITD